MPHLYRNDRLAQMRRYNRTPQRLRSQREHCKRYRKRLIERLGIATVRKQWAAKQRKRVANPCSYIAYLGRKRVRSVLKGRSRSRSTAYLTSCTTLQLRAHFQRQFKRGMSWDNYGTVWEADHIVPCASFDLTKPAERRRCFHFSNLRPLWRKANSRRNQHRTVQAQLPM